MSNPKITDQANPHMFQFGTTHRTEDGFEFAIIAKSCEQLSRAWEMIAGPVAFDETKISRVKIKRA